MASRRGGRARFVFTKIAVFALTVGVFVWLWAAIAWANVPGGTAPSDDGTASEVAAAEEEEWVWDDCVQDWVLESEAVPCEPTPAPAEDVSVVVVERQPIQYVYTYVYEKPVYVEVPVEVPVAVPASGSTAPPEGSDAPSLPTPVAAPGAAATPTTSGPSSSSRPLPAPTSNPVSGAAPWSPPTPVPPAPPPPPPPTPVPPTPVPPTPVPPTPTPTRPPKPTATPTPKASQGS